MALKHYDGPRLPGDPAGQPIPVPPPRQPAASVAPRSEVTPLASPAPGAVAAPVAPSAFPPEYQGVTVVIQGTEPGAPEVIGVGPTLDAAIAAARTKWATAHVVPLMWADGNAVEGLAQQVLIEALELFETQVGASAEIMAMVTRLKFALGAEDR